MRISLIFVALVFIIACDSGNGGYNDPLVDSGEFYENGQVRIEKFKDGNNEKWVFWQEDGSCWEEKYFENGEVVKVIGFYPGCEKRVLVETKGGNRHGEWKYWFENGELWEEGQYINGYPVGVFNFYDTTGVKLNSHIYIESGGYSNIAFPVPMNLHELKEYLIDRTDFQEMDNVEVAGEEYYFPELHWNESRLYFDERVEEDSLIACMGGEITDDVFVFGEDIKVGMDKAKLLDIFELDLDDSYNMITIKDTSVMKFFEYTIKENKVSTITFGGLYPR